MFDSEAQMKKPVIRWMNSLGLGVRAEFVTPWGICDLVGLSFRSPSVRHRCRLGQDQAITSITRAALLSEIPDIQTGESISLRSLVKKYEFVMSPDIINEQTEWLIAEKYVLRTSTGHFQKRNGWLPLHKRLIAVELKLNRIEDVMVQARSNLLFAEESYVALPHEVCRRVLKSRDRWAQFFDCGIGLVSVSPSSCKVLIRSKPPTKADFLLQFCVVEKFWRSRSRRS